MIVRLTGGGHPSGSVLDRAIRCPASVALPQVIDDHDSEPRDKGTALHVFLDRCAQVGREAALDEVDERWREVCAQVETVKLADALRLSTEVAVAYDWVADTARVLQPLEPRAYEIDESREVALTIDVAGFADGTVYSGDYKGPRAWLPAPEQSMQLGTGALALARIFGASTAVVEYVRLRDDGEPVRWRAELDVFGLEAAADRVATAMARVTELRAMVATGATPNVTEGPWCRYCPARTACPAKTALIRAAMGSPPSVSLPITPDNAAHVYERWRQAKTALSMIEGAIHAYAKYTPVPIGTDEDGSARWFGELSRPGNEQLDGAVTHQVIAELYGGEAANAVVTMEATKSAVTNVIRPLIQGTDRSLKECTEEVLAKVRERGGVSRKATTTTTEYSVAPDGAAKARKRKAV